MVELTLEFAMNNLRKLIPAIGLFLLTAMLSESVMSAPLTILQTSGTDVRADGGKGQIVPLHGVNLGGWLLMEGWMSPLDSSGLKDDFAVRETLIKRFGEPTANKMLDAYEDNWITDTDLDHIAAMHLNVVRVPFWYRNLESEDGTWRDDAFKHLDWVVKHAADRGIYTILDFHGLPGGQCGSDTTGHFRKNPEFWTRSANQDRAVEIWKKVARHFAGDPAVAAYDLINEPIGAPDRDQLWAVYDRMYRAVRDVDPRHMISIEGCWVGQVDGKYHGWGLGVLPPPEKFAWTNVLYQVHSYEWDWKDPNKQFTNNDSVMADFEKHRSWNVPMYVGEFNVMGQEKAWVDAIQKYSHAGIAWTPWSYKAIHGTGDDSWGLYNPKKPMPEKPDITHDSAEVIAEKWSKWNTADAFVVNPMLARVMGEMNKSQGPKSQSNPKSQ